MSLAKGDFRNRRANVLIARGQKTIRRNRNHAAPSRIVIVKIEFWLVRSKNQHLLFAVASLSIGGFVLKVMSNVRFGFAAGCAAVALPRRRWCFDIWSYALGVAFAQ